MTVNVCANGVALAAEVIPMGGDLCVVVTGGNRPHLGCTALAVPHSGITDPNLPSATVSTLNLPAHRDDYLANQIAKVLSSILAHPVAVVCGVHFDCFSAEVAANVEYAGENLCQEILKQMGK